MEITKVWFDKNYLFVEIDSGHIIGNPISWYKRLENATEMERLNFNLGVNKKSIHWYGIDEDLSLESLFDFNRELIYANI